MNSFALGGFKLTIGLIDDSSSQISSEAAKTAQQAASAIAAKLALLTKDGTPSASNTPQGPSLLPITEGKSVNEVVSGSITATSNSSSSSSAIRKVLLEGLISVEEISDPELKNEISEEARKYGMLEKIHIGLNSSGRATVSLLYADGESARRAHTAMNGRFFGGRTVKSSLACDNE
jgi:hypothetical protein